MTWLEQKSNSDWLKRGQARWQLDYHYGPKQFITTMLQNKKFLKFLSASFYCCKISKHNSIHSVVFRQNNILMYLRGNYFILLSGYFIVNEILKSYPENPLWPHWMLVPMVSAFLNSFRFVCTFTAANIIAILLFSFFNKSTPKSLDNTGVGFVGSVEKSTSLQQ